MVWEKFAQLWQIEMREVPLTLEKTTLDPEEALKMCDENTTGGIYVDRNVITGLGIVSIQCFVQCFDVIIQSSPCNTLDRHDTDGGFILPFLYPEKKWDFRLKWVLSISVSGHKFGRQGVSRNHPTVLRQFVLQIVQSPFGVLCIFRFQIPDE